MQHYISFILHFSAFVFVSFLLCYVMCPTLYFIHINLFLFFNLTVEMARQKLVLRTCSKSITVEGASTEHVDEETNQEMHEAST